jgi:hypothetical protein
MLAFVAALLLTAITVSSACVAGSVEPLRFTIEPNRNDGLLQVSFKRYEDGHYNHNWSDSFRPDELAGLDVAALRAAGNSPIRFAIVREAGRVDCAGNGANSMAIGTCSVTADQGFNRFLEASGVGRPDADDTFGLIAVGAKREIVTAVKAANYPIPNVDKLMELAAVEVTPAYIRSLAGQGYRPRNLQELVEFAALKITPEFIGGFVRAGYTNLDADDLVQLKALNITPAFIAGFERIGYGRLPVDTLVELKAMDVTPEFVKAVQQDGELPSPQHLVEIRAVTEDIRKR